MQRPTLSAAPTYRLGPPRFFFPSRFRGVGFFAIPLQSRLDSPEKARNGLGLTHGPRDALFFFLPRSRSRSGSFLRFPPQPSSPRPRGKLSSSCGGGAYPMLEVTAKKPVAFLKKKNGGPERGTGLPCLLCRLLKRFFFFSFFFCSNTF